MMTKNLTSTAELSKKLGKLWVDYEASVIELSKKLDKLWTDYETLMTKESNISNKSTANKEVNGKESPALFIGLSEIQAKLKKLIDEAISVTNDTQITSAVIKRAYSLYDAVNASICDTGFVSCR